jgi:hypothetical protein
MAKYTNGKEKKRKEKKREKRKKRKETKINGKKKREKGKQRGWGGVMMVKSLTFTSQTKRFPFSSSFPHLCHEPWPSLSPMPCKHQPLQCWPFQWKERRERETEKEKEKEKEKY